MKKNATTIKSYRVTLFGAALGKNAVHRVQAKRAQDALVHVCGSVWPSRYRQDGALKHGRTVVWVSVPSSTLGLRLRDAQGNKVTRPVSSAVVVEVVRLVSKKPMGAPVRDPGPAREPAPMTTGAIFVQLGAEDSALLAELAKARAENAQLRGLPSKPAAPKPAPETKPESKAPKPSAEDTALLAELEKARAENARLKGLAPKPAAPKPAPKAAKSKPAARETDMLAEIRAALKAA
jgi:hypothetical protein